MRLSVTSTSLSEDVRIAAAAAQRAGFSGVVVPLQSGSVDLTELGDTGSREYLRILRSFNQNLVAIDCSLGKDGFAPKTDIDQSLARLSKAIRTAADLGRTMLCLDLGPLPPAPVTERPRPKVTQEQAGAIILPDFADFHDSGSSRRESSVADQSKSQPQRSTAFEASLEAALRELGQMADRHGVMVAMRSSLSSLAAIEYALSRAGCSWFGVELDCVHLLADDWPMDEAFSRLGTLLRHVRVRDALKGEANRIVSCEMGSGHVNWAQLVANLEAAGYRGAMTVDTADLANRSASAERARSALARLTDRSAGPA